MIELIWAQILCGERQGQINIGLKKMVLAKAQTKKCLMDTYKSKQGQKKRPWPNKNKAQRDGNWQIDRGSKDNGHEKSKGREELNQNRAQRDGHGQIKIGHKGMAIAK